MDMFRWPPSVSEVLNGNTLRCVNGAVEVSDFSAIKATVRGLLFGAQWCPPCRQWVKQLAPVYEKMKAKGISLEIVFCSSDRTQEAFDQFITQILESILGLGDVELPLICIVDGLAGQLCVCERPDVSETVLNEFVGEYRAGRLQWVPLPATTQSAVGHCSSH
uniref:Thioredoxin-like_fold domain-containing protein n=1 Tax=Angiostrongylus cantonensis TaxID=6313 RepID=A0A0K0DKK7_ANGCA